jgi:tRNA threonylcarbamoyl adenosine modification protein YjeE
MTQEARSPIVWSMEARDEASTVALANDVASLVRPGDLVTLTGDLGSGKTTFARALIRALVGDPALEAPSPTFTLMQVYEAPDYKIVHADLYRIEKSTELTDLGWEDIVEDALVLVEWPEHASDLFAGDRLEVGLAYDVAGDAGVRKITLTGYSAAGARLAAFKALRELLGQTGWADAQRSYLQGDASTRAYERLTKPNGESAILMISPSRPDGPPIRYGRSYSAIARLAENIKSFVAMSEGLRSQGLSAPKIYGADVAAGLSIIEDLGGEGILDANGRPIAERYLVAIAVLAHLHARKLPDMLPVKGAGFHHIPPYDLDALLIEIELIVDWYAARVESRTITSGARATFINLWRQVLIEIANAPTTWTLRDYHSPNLLWLQERDGLARVGLLDFQDCVLGHPAYDVVSLGQDARVDVSDDLELKLLGSYARLRREVDPEFDVVGFARAYSILGAQRATKVLGIFARLDQRDQKPQYLAHLPRVASYLEKNLRHPALADIKAWYEANLPNIFRAAE